MGRTKVKPRMSHVCTPAASASGSGRGVGLAAVRDQYPGVVPETKLEIQMLHDRLLVKAVPDKSERRSSAGLVIPDTVKLATRLAWGEVRGAGTGARHVKTGDRVLFDPEEQGEVELNGERYVVLRERDVHAIANEAPDRGTGLYL
ncbi:hypothetical protein GCM10028793_41500 [Nocardiopsis oceani]